jgi:hypothetical protein
MSDYIPTCSADPTIDLGHGVTAEVRRIDGQIDGVHYWHECNGKMRVGRTPTTPPWPDGWTVVSESPLTLSPSLLCPRCGHHGFIRDGKWVPA